MSLLQSLERGGWLRTVDLALAESLQHTRDQTPDLVLAATALASRALANGHSRLPLSQVRELLLEITGEREPPALPPLEEWLTVLRASPWVATPAGAQDACVLMLEDDALSLRRYWQYEARLAAAITSRLTAIGHDATAMR